MSKGFFCGVRRCFDDPFIFYRHIACRHGNAHMCLIFIAQGADLQIKNETGETPLDCVPDGNSACAKLLKYNIALKSIVGPKNTRIILSK